MHADRARWECAPERLARAKMPGGRGFDRGRECPYDERVGSVLGTGAAPCRALRAMKQTPHLLPPRSTAGQLTLDQHIGVRIPGGQPIDNKALARVWTAIQNAPYDTENGKGIWMPTRKADRSVTGRAREGSRNIQAERLDGGVAFWNCRSAASVNLHPPGRLMHSFSAL